jgi:GT2 family glycosyltransferase
MSVLTNALNFAKGKFTITDLTDAAGAGTLDSTLGELATLMGATIQDPAERKQFFDWMREQVKAGGNKSALTVAWVNSAQDSCEAFHRKLKKDCPGGHDVKTNFWDIPSEAKAAGVKNYKRDKGKSTDINTMVDCIAKDGTRTQNWLQPILETFKNEPNTAIVQPKILDYKHKDYFEYAGAGGGFIDKYGYPFCRGRVFETIEKDLGQYNDTCNIFWASGACFFIRSSVFKELNGFDSDFFAHQEEIDLCWRAINKKYSVKYNGLSSIYHVGGATLNEENPKKTFLNFRNSLFMLTKNLPKEELFRIIFIRMLLDGIAGVRFLFQGKFAHFFAVLKAHFYYYHSINRNLKKRAEFQVSSYFNRNSIVFDNYIKKRHNF